MSAISISARPYSLSVFFILAFGFSWVVWIPTALASHGLIPLGPNPVLNGVLGTIGPSLAALISTAIFDGHSGFSNLFKRLLTWRVGLQWYLFVLLWPAVLSLAITGFSVWLGGSAPNFSEPPFVDIFSSPPSSLLGIHPFAFLPFFFFQQLLFGSPMGEELGWRGYALPRLMAQGNSLRASLILGMMWGLWHLPLWLTKGNSAYEPFIGWHFLELLATSVLFTWVYNNTNGSVLLALLFHASIGVTGLFLSSVEFHPLISVILSWGWVALIMGVSNLQRQMYSAKPQNQT